MAPLGIIFTLLLCLEYICAQDDRAPDPNNRFIYPPPPGPQYSDDPTVYESNLLFTVEIQSAPFKWITNMTNMTVSLNQEGNPSVVSSTPLTLCGATTSVYWNGSLGKIDLANGNVAFLAVWNCSRPSTAPVFFSHYFNLTKPAVSSSSIIAPQISASSSILSSISTSVLSGPSIASSTPATTSQVSNPGTSISSSNVAAIGGGVGGGIGGALLVIALAFLCLRRRRQDRESGRGLPWGRSKQRQQSGLKSQFDQPAQLDFRGLLELPPESVPGPDNEIHGSSSAGRSELHGDDRDYSGWR